MRAKWLSVQYFDEDGDVVLVEILPEREHDEGNDCWCGPVLMQNCGECLPGDGTRDEDCWKCGGEGLVDYDDWAGRVPIVVHNDPRLP